MELGEGGVQWPVALKKKVCSGGGEAALPADGRWLPEGGEEEIGKDGWAVGRWRWVVSSAAPEPPIGMEDVGRGRGGRRLQLRRDESQ